MSYSSPATSTVASVPRRVRLTTLPVVSSPLPRIATVCPNSSSDPERPLSSTFILPSVESSITAPYSR